MRKLVEGPFLNSMLLEGVTASGAPSISHSGYLAPVDGDLKIRGVYDSNDIQALERLMHDARYLARRHRSYKFGGGPRAVAGVAAGSAGARSAAAVLRRWGPARDTRRRCSR